MSGQPRAIVVFGDVVRSRDEPATSTSWLRTLEAELDAAIPGRLAGFGFTQGDELQGLLRPDADPLEPVLRGSLHAEALPMRWVVAAGPVEPGRGPATQRTGPAFLAAREMLEAARARRDRLLIAVGRPATDALLDDLAPVLGDLLAELTVRQREVARLMLVDGMRQADVAERLEVKRATVSVLAERARVRRIAGLAAALRRLVDGSGGADG